MLLFHNIQDIVLGGEFMDYRKLRGAIIGTCGSIGKCAEKLGIDRATLSTRLNGRSEWRADEIRKLTVLLSIPTEELHLYFFAEML